jgi:DNA primase
MIQDTDLGRIIENDLGEPAKKYGRWLFWCCPFHADDSPSLGVTPDTGTWYCFGCSKSGDAVAWLREYRKMDFKEAHHMLSMKVPLRHAMPKTPAARRVVQPPDSGWQSKSREVIEQCVRVLWSEGGVRARGWLHARGLNDDALHEWQIGYNPGNGGGCAIAGLHVPHGIVIPCVVDGAIWYVKIRRPDGKPKYLNVKGGRPALFGVNTLVNHSVAVLCEGEFDAMLLEQECGDLAGVATLGSASGRLDLQNWAKYLLPVSRLLAAYDVDAAGKKGASNFLQLTARARTIRVPKINSQDKDITDFYKAGGRLRDWLACEMERLSITGPSRCMCQNDVVLDSGARLPSSDLRNDRLSEMKSATGERDAEQRLCELFDRWEAAENADDMEWVRAWAEASIAAGMPCYHGGAQDLGAEGWQKWAADYRVNLG